jgi:hypothetical protein
VVHLAVGVSAAAINFQTPLGRRFVEGKFLEGQAQDLAQFVKAKHYVKVGH